MVNTYHLRYTNDFWLTLAPTLKETGKFSLLEVGCGPGLFLADLRQRFPETQLTGLDEKEGMLVEARQRNPDLKFFQGLFDEEFLKNHSNSYDFIFFGFLFHELDDPLATLAAMKSQIINPDGAVIIYDFIISSLQAYLEIWPGKDEKAKIKRFPGPAKYNLEDIVYLLERSGYNVSIKKNILPLTGLIIAEPE